MTLVSTVRRAALRLASLAPALLTVVALVLAPRVARAQAVTGIVGAVGRFEPSGADANDFTKGNPHPGGVPQNVINFEDCEANLSFQFTLSLSATYPNLDLVAWAGPVDCTAAAAREAPNPTCWPLRATPIPQSGPVDEAGAPTTTFTLNMRDIASHAGTSATTYPISTTYTAAGESICSAQTTDVQTPIAIYFFFANQVGPGDAVGTAAQAYPIVVDTRAQTVGTGFTVQQQLDSQLTVTVTAVSDSDTTLYNIYCDPPPGQETVISYVPADAATNGGRCPVDSGSVADASGSTADAASDASGEASDDASSAPDGAADAGGDDAATLVVDSGQPVAIYDDAGGDLCGVSLNDAGVPSVGTCNASILQSGYSGQTVGILVPETNEAGTDITDDAGNPIYVEAGVPANGTQVLGIPAKNLCGTVSVSDATYTITGLRDGYYYTIGVAAVDGAGNVGPLSIQCGNPVQLADFWYQYTSEGGRGGGGYCSSAAAGVGVPAGTGGLGILMVASVIALVRARKRRR